MIRHQHDWQRDIGGSRENPGCYSSGGSVVRYERCSCGAKSKVDYWNHRTNRPISHPKREKVMT